MEIIMFKTRGLLSTISVLFFLAFTNISHAQYLGPGEMKADTSVSQIMTKPTDGQQVLLKGYIIKRISKKYYEFKDDTGTISAKISENLFYNQKVTENSLVQIFGEVDTLFTEKPIIKVFHIKVLKP